MSQAKDESRCGLAIDCSISLNDTELLQAIPEKCHGREYHLATQGMCGASLLFHHQIPPSPPKCRHGDHKSVDEVVLARNSTTNVFQYSKGKVMRGAGFCVMKKQ